MRLRTTRFRSLCVSIAAVLALAQTMPARAWAQSAPSPAAVAAAPADQPAGDPPERVGRLAVVSGAVSYHEPNADQWSPAGLNDPVTAGDAFWTQPNASAEMEIGASHVAMNGGTELEVGTLDDSGLQAVLPQGEVYLDTQDLAPNETWSVQTPRGLVMLARAGRYDVVAGDTRTPTTVTVLDGSAQLSGPGVGLQVGPGQTATITGTRTFAASVASARSDPFLTAMVKAGHPPPAAAPAAVAQMPGGADLAAYGTWSQTADYGEVWYPDVGSGWVPYRDGYWAYVTPWGWTWIDNEPWAFAPMHYGRWVEIDGRWAWTPGAITAAAPPVYAPALVSFFSIGVGVGVGIGAALAAGSIGWCPLGPHEPYRPWYHASDRYRRSVNVRDVSDANVINRHVTINDFVDRRAMTVVPGSALAGSRPIERLAAHVDARTLAAAHPLFGRDPVRPTAATVGVTPRFARQMHLAAAPVGMAAVGHAGAPGPTLRPGVAAGGHPMLRGPAAHGAVPQPAAIAPHPTMVAHRPALRPADAHATPPPIRPGTSARHPATGRHRAAASPVTAAPRPMFHQPRPAPMAAMPGHGPHFAPPPRSMFRASAPRPVFHPAVRRPMFHQPRTAPMAAMPGHGPHFAPPPRSMFRASAPRPVFHPAVPRPTFHPPAPHPASRGPERRP